MKLTSVFSILLLFSGMVTQFACAQDRPANNRLELHRGHAESTQSPGSHQRWSGDTHPAIARYPLGAQTKQSAPALAGPAALPYQPAAVLGVREFNAHAIGSPVAPLPVAQQTPVAKPELRPTPEGTELRSAQLVESGYFGQTLAPEFQLERRLVMPAVPRTRVVPATRDPRANSMLAPYQTRGAILYPGNEQVAGSGSDAKLPEAYQPWWNSQIASTLSPGRTGFPVSLDALIEHALQHSPHIQLAATKPLIRQSSVFEESAQFDWKSFVEAKYDDTNDPIGNTLTTGNNDNRFRQQEWYSRNGLRRKNNRGGETELVQRLGVLDNNSRFLVPRNQGSARLELNYRHPLMKGQGQAVNESLILLADIDFRAAGDEFLGNLQRHLAEITETYWELVRARSEYLQKQKLLVSAEGILTNLVGRAEVDALDRQVYRARAVVAKRRAEIARSSTAIRNAESRLRLLVNSPSMVNASALEFVPVDLPTTLPWSIELPDAVSTAIVHRPDISRAIRDVKAANVRNGVASNELLPKLDLLLGAYVAGLDGDSDYLNSWVKQFRDGRPGFNVGFEFEIPMGNRAARARSQRSQWEVSRAMHQFRVVIESGVSEVEIAVREVQTARQEIVGRYHAMVAASNESEFLKDRWQTLPEVDDSATLLLEDLLDSQERLADEEAAYSKAQFDYLVAVVRLKRSMGTLFQFRQ